MLVVAEGEEADLDRFVRAIKFEDPLIKVEDIAAQFSDPLGAWDEFYKIAGERETDSRLDTATVFLKELIVVVKDGFTETNSKLSSVDARLGSIDSKLGTVATKLDRIADTQEKIACRLDSARRDIVSEVKGLRRDLQRGMDARLRMNRTRIDVAGIRARMNLRTT